MAGKDKGKRGGGGGAGGKKGSGSSGASQAQTGTSDPTYNLVSVLYHALQGAENYERYADDAQRGGDDDLADFFRDIQEEERERADRAKELLASRLEGTGSEEDDDEEDEEDEEDEDEDD